MNAKALLVGFVAFAGLLAATAVSDQQTLTPSEKTKQMEALVNKAAVLIDRNGRGARSMEIQITSSGPAKSYVFSPMDTHADSRVDANQNSEAHLQLRGGSDSVAKASSNRRVAISMLGSTPL